jgi:hypothetical protein
LLKIYEGADGKILKMQQKSQSAGIRRLFAPITGRTENQRRERREDSEKRGKKS